MHSDAVTPLGWCWSNGNNHKNNPDQQIVLLYKPFLFLIRQLDTRESVLTVDIAVMTIIWSRGKLLYFWNGGADVLI